MADDEEIEIEACECGEPWCDRCAYQRELAVEANPCTACNGSGLAPPKDERCRPSAYGESMGKEHPVIVSVVGEIDGSRVLRFEGEGVESYVTLSEEQAQKLGRVLLVVWRPDSAKFSDLIGAFNELQAKTMKRPGPHTEVTRLFEAIQALRESAVSVEDYSGPFICGEPREDDPRYRKPVLEEGVEFWRPRGWERVEYEDDLADWVGPGTIWRIPGSDAPSAELLELAGS